jgi:CRP/FNR family transcriptional regulator
MTKLFERQSPSLMETLEARTREAVIKKARRLVFSDGEMINLRGEPVDKLYIVRSGACRMCRIDQNGREKLIAVFGPGQAIGVLQLLLEKPRTVDIFADGATELWSISRDSFSQLQDEYPDFTKALLTIMLHRFNSVLEQLDDNDRLPLVVRVAKLLVSMHASSDATTIDWSQSDLALLLGSSRVATGKALRQLSDEEMISLQYASIKVSDIDKLKDWVFYQTGDILGA